MTVSKKWLKITLPCKEELTEAVSDLMGVLSGAGVEIHPDRQNGLNEISGFFALEAPQDGSWQEAGENIRTNVRAELNDLFSLYDETLPELRTGIFDDQEWATSWQQYFTTFEIVPGLIIKPSWETYTPTGNQHLLEMDPGMAFGTGQHESTRLALSLLASCIQAAPRQIRRVLDVGTGTGILAMAAALFGADRIVAIDNDPDAVAVAGQNVRHNKLSGTINVLATPLAEITGKFDLICANIVHDVLIEMVPDFLRLLGPGGFVVLAGILAGDQAQSINAYYKHHGMHTLTERQEGKWTAMLLRHHI